MENLPARAAVSAGKGVAPAAPLCCGMSCLDTHESEAQVIPEGEGFSSAHAVMMSSKESALQGP